MNAAPNTIRPRALEIAYINDFITTDDVVEITGCEKSQAVKALGNLKSDGFVISEPGEQDGKKCALYSITKAGRVKVENNRRASTNGKSAAENTAASVQTAEESRIDVVGSNGNDGLHYDEAMAKAAFMQGQIDGLKAAIDAMGSRLKTVEMERKELRLENEALAAKLASGPKQGTGKYLVSGYACSFQDLETAKEYAEEAVIKRSDDDVRVHIGEVIATVKLEPARPVWEE